MLGLFFFLQNFTVFYDHVPKDMHAYTIVEKAKHKSTSYNFIFIDGLLACQVYFFRVAVGMCSLSDAVSTATAPGRHCFIIGLSNAKNYKLGPHLKLSFR